MADKPIIIPSNQIITKYTSGNEYVNLSTSQLYQGYYYEFNGKKFTGKEFNPTASVLIEKNSTKVNPILSNPVFSSYVSASINSPSIINSQTEPPYISNTSEEINFNEDGLTYSAYFYWKVVDKQVLIKRISEETYNNYKNNPAYKVVEVQLSIGGTSIFPEEMEKAEKEMPGFVTWFRTDNQYQLGMFSYPTASNFTI